MADRRNQVSIGVRLPEPLLDEVDRFGATLEGRLDVTRPSRSEAVRQLLLLGLEVAKMRKMMEG